YELGSQLKLDDPEHWLGDEDVGDPAPWPMHFWLGGWDSDVLCGFTRGSAVIGAAAQPRSGSRRPAEVTDRRP
ncbi:MAG: hypothetical protein ABWY04_16725, partial [Arthrobacter sp.]